MKLCLGTVQFGLDYGINNKQGKIPGVEIDHILNYAHKNDIAMIDTASAYGNSESVLGETLNKTDKQFQIITKYPANQSIHPFTYIDISLQNLKTKKVYGYLFHNYSIFQKHQDYIDDFISIKEYNKSEKIGFSLYYPAEAELILQNNIPCDIVQVPYNIFDQRFSGIFPDLKSKDIEIHIRSVFLQGLFFIHPAKLDKQFDSIKKSLGELIYFAKKNQLSMSALCLGFANANRNIDKIIVGVDSLNNLKENITNYNKLSNLQIDYRQFEHFSVDDENIILPFNWKN
jgi:aryl-alcohol dehydrogenase-like predicted oxidoreductase